MRRPAPERRILSAPCRQERRQDGSCRGLCLHFRSSLRTRFTQKHLNRSHCVSEPAHSLIRANPPLTSHGKPARTALARCCLGLLTVLAAAPLLGWAGGQPLYLNHLTMEDGLSQSTVMAILQDSQGFMWFGTESGLNRYDGQQVYQYLRSRDPASGGLPNDYVWALDEDADGNLWVATYGGGVAHWNRRLDRFVTYAHDPADPDSLSGDQVRTLLVDSDNVLWVGTEGAGLDRRDPHASRFERIGVGDSEHTRLPDANIYALVEDAAGSLWIGTDGGLSRYDPDRNEFTHFRHDPEDGGSLSDDRVRSLFIDSAGMVWVGTFTGGLNRLDPASGHFRHFAHSPDDPGSLSHDHVRAIVQDREARLWVATENGLNLYQPTTGTFEHFYNDDSPRGLQDSYIMSIHQDRGGVLWLGTRARGVSRWDPASWALGHFLPDSLRDTQVTAFATDEDSVWVGTFGHGLQRFFHRPDTPPQLIDHTHPELPLADDRVMALLRDRHGTMWAGTMTGGLHRFDPDTGKMTIYRHDPDDSNSLSSNGVMSLLEDRSGQIVIGTYDGGVTRLDPVSGRMRHYDHNPADPDTLSSSRATSVVEDRQGMLWVATDAGLNLLDPDSGTVTRFSHRPGDPASLSVDSLYALHVDAGGRIWVGTAGGGLDRVVGSALDPDTIRFENMSRADGLAGDVVYGILSDANGVLWISGNHGLTRYDPRLRSVRTFRVSHGLQGEEFNFGAYHHGLDGRLYFGGANGYNAFLPAALREDSSPPPLVLTRFEIDGQSAIDAPPWVGLPGITIAHNQRMFTFGFAALDYSAPERNRYRYRLEGFDEDWIEAGNQHQATYTNIDPGSYTFRVRAANSNGDWNTEGLALALTVQPPPWATWWAQLGYVGAGLAVAALLLQAYHRRRQQEHAYRERLEAEVRERTVELAHSNEELQRLAAAKGEFVARMSHELRTPMNGVLGMVELLLTTRLDPTQRRFADTVQRSGLRLLGIINDILDFSKIEADRIELESLPFDLEQLCNEVTELLAARAQDKQIELCCQIPAGGLPAVIGDSLRLRQVLINLVGNAVKFTNSGEVLLQVNVAASGTDDGHVRLRFEVRDTGTGIPADALEHIFDAFAQADGSTSRQHGGTGLGLAISRQLLELHGADLKVVSTPGTGSTFYFELELERQADAGRTPFSPRLSGERVLLLSDTRWQQHLLCHTLIEWGAEVSAVVSGEQMLALAQRSAASNQPFTTVIIDQTAALTTAIVGGIASRAVEALPEARTVILSPLAAALIDPPIHTRYLTKPITRSSLAELFGAIEAAHSVPAADALLPGPTTDAAPAATHHVLLVEDDPVNQQVFRGLLAEIGIDVSVVDDGESAVATAHPDLHDLVLMDCGLPGIDGVEATRQLRTRLAGTRRHLPIIALTASAMDSDRRNCLDAGMDDFLSKPCHLKDLRVVLENWLGVKLPSPGTATSPPAMKLASPPATDTSANRTPPAPDANTELVDVTALERIRAIGRSGERDMLAHVVELYERGATQDIERLRDGLANGDPETVRRAAHKLKSASANLGAHVCADLCRALEKAGASGDLAGAAGTLTHLAELVPRVIRQLQLETRRKIA